MSIWAHNDLARELTALKYCAERAWKLSAKTQFEPADIEKLEYVKYRIDKMLSEAKESEAA